MNNDDHHETEGTVADRLQQESEQACQHLQAMAKLCCDAAGPDKADAVLAALSFNWTVTADAQQLADGMLDQALAAASEQSPVRQGHVYCYLCGGASCDHSSPTGPGDVFMGYSNSGEPVWQEFFGALNGLGDDRVGSVFDDRAKPLARFVPRKRLIQEQLIGSGRNSMTYRILCQVVAGYFEVSGKRCALTIQVVENPARRLFLQLLAPDEVHVAMTEDVRKHRALSRLHAAVSDLRHRLVDLQADWTNAQGRKERLRMLGHIDRLLNHQVAVIERKGRQHARRTKHAHERGEEKRPIHTAMSDLKEAKPDGFFRDKPRNSIVVIGKRGRAHVFSVEGKHITTLQLSQEKLDRRVQRNRYAPMTSEEVREFRTKPRFDEDNT